MAVRTKTQFETLYGTTGTVFPDNTTGEISEADVRAFGQDVADSFAFDSLKQATASGTDTYTATISGVVAYATHDIYEIIFTNANTGSSTININSLGAKTLKKSVSTNLASGDILAGQSFIIVYDGTNFQVIGIGGGGSFTLTDGNGTTANGTAVDLGGPLTANAIIDGDTNTYSVEFINLNEFWAIANGDMSLAGDAIGMDSAREITLNAGTAVYIGASALNEVQGANIASATTTDIGAATGNYINVTGTTTITGLGTIQEGSRRIVTFTGILTLTHNGTSLILPTAANITTAAGDVAEFVSLGTGNWKCTNYQRADGTALVGASSLSQSDVTFDGMGAVVLVNSIVYFRVAAASTISGWSIVAEGTSPTCTLDIFKIATGTTLPTASICAAALPALSTGNALKSTTLTGWTTSVAADDIIAVKVTACAAATKINFTIYR